MLLDLTQYIGSQLFFNFKFNRCSVDGKVCCVGVMETELNELPLPDVSEASKFYTWQMIAGDSKVGLYWQRKQKMATSCALFVTYAG